jgi:hypothetical protein
MHNFRGFIAAVKMVNRDYDRRVEDAYKKRNKTGVNQNF